MIKIRTMEPLFQTGFGIFGNARPLLRILWVMKLYVINHLHLVMCLQASHMCKHYPKISNIILKWIFIGAICMQSYVSQMWIIQPVYLLFRDYSLWPFVLILIIIMESNNNRWTCLVNFYIPIIPSKMCRLRFCWHLQYTNIHAQ